VIKTQNKQHYLPYDIFSEEERLTPSKLKSLKVLIAELLRDKMCTQDLTKTALAAQLGTSRSALERLLDPQNTSITLQTLAKALELTGKKIHFFIQN